MIRGQKEGRKRRAAAGLLLAACLLCVCGPLTAKAARGMAEAEKAYAMGDTRSTLALALPFAKKGDEKAQLLICLVGVFGNAPDFETARPWCEKSAARGKPEAHLALYEYYRSGPAHALDEEKALEHLRLSAQGDYPPAHLELVMRGYSESPALIEENLDILEHLLRYYSSSRRQMPERTSEAADLLASLWLMAPHEARAAAYARLDERDKDELEHFGINRADMAVPAAAASAGDQGYSATALDDLFDVLVAWGMPALFIACFIMLVYLKKRGQGTGRTARPAQARAYTPGTARTPDVLERGRQKRRTMTIEGHRRKLG